MNEQAIVQGQATGIARESFGGREIERRGETATSALAAQARAEIESRYVMAMKHPRSFDDVRVKMLRECERPGFAIRAFYSVPRGDKPGRLTKTRGRIEGLSIRFAEACIRLAGNVFQQTQTTYDDDFKRIVRVACVDLETNSAYSKDVVIDKTIERREVKDGRVVLGQRQNSTGATVFILQATEEELLQKENALCSRALRTEALRLIPADILEECERRIVETCSKEDAKDPDAARKRIVDGFASLGVMPSDLAIYLGCDFASASPAQMQDLRGLYAAVSEGEISFADALKAVTTIRDVPAQGEAVADEKQKAQATKLVDKIRARGAKVAAKKSAKDSGEGAPGGQGSHPGTSPTHSTPSPVAGSPSEQAGLSTDAKCVDCGNPVGKDAVASWTRDGEEGWRHPECRAPEPA